MRPYLPLLSLALLITGCSHYATVSQRDPVFTNLRGNATTFSDYQHRLVKAVESGKRNPSHSLGNYLAAAKAAQEYLRSHPHDRNARESYNFAVARVFSSLRKSKADPWAGPFTAPSDSGDFLIEHSRDKRKGWNPSLYTFTPADEIEMKGIYVTERISKDGIGAPLVAVGKHNNKNARAEFSLPKVYYGVTAIADFEGNKCLISFRDPLAVEDVTFDGHSYPLAADFTTPLAVMLAESKPEKMELSRLLRPQNYAETARISRLQPYDPNKTVVLVIHGLKDSPATWAPMINHLRADAKIRDNYQFWFYSYPSGYPYPYSAMILRKELDAVGKKFPLKRKMVVIGHSMGGCISRLLITDSGNTLWNRYFAKPPSEVRMTPQSRQFAEEALIFRHRPEVGRVIFIAAPLKGSDLASGWIGRLSSRLVRAPLTLLTVGADAMKSVVTTGDSLKVNGIPNSVDTLAPNNRFVQEINKLPLTPGIPYHTIMGDRGKGGNHDKTPPVQSDGIVPYWSSQMKGAQSELVVPSGHSAHQNPQAIVEVNRILRLHAGTTER
jgi:pimeloyl-ACP methyl ester carboxylesterase